MPFKNHTALSVRVTEWDLELQADSITLEAAAGTAGLEQLCCNAWHTVAGAG